jgi:hypothetical protein
MAKKTGAMIGDEILKKDKALDNLRGGEREEEVLSEFGELQVSMKVREEIMIEEYHEKISREEKEIHSEKDRLEFVVSGLQGAIAFGDTVEGRKQG